MVDFLAKLLVLLLPMYVANSTAMLFGGKTPIDFGKKFFDKKPVFGSGKTFRGAFVGIFLGTATAFLIQLFFPSISAVLSTQYLLFGFLSSAGAIAGDITASFFKRRSGIPQGTPVLFLDQLDFVAGALIFGSAIFVPDFYELIIIFAVTLVSHKLSNYIAFKAKLKKVPW